MKHSLISVKSEFTKRDENTSPADLRKKKSAVIWEICENYFQMKKLIIILVLVGIHFFMNEISAFAQLSFIRQDSIPVSISGNLLKNPWAGGLNAPQFSPIDLNGDGIKDLFVFDRSGNRILPFINRGIKDSVSFVYASEYISKFPSMHDFALLVDYNCDGKEDIFTYSNGGMAVFRNDYNSSTGLKFTKITSLLYSQYYSNFVNLYVSPTNIPAFSDIDNDGDIDILTFDILGSFVEFHQNRSMELYSICDSLKFVMNTACWGKFAGNSNSNSAFLGMSCKANTITTTTDENKILHSGSSLLAIDIDGDKDKDLIIGDILSSNLLLLINGGDTSNANMTAQDTSFPSKYKNTISTNLTSFPSPYYIDVNNDGKKDLIVAPNATNMSENFAGVWYYKNTGTSTAPVFNFVKNSFLQDEMIEVGEGSNPVFFDYDADELLDLVIGNYGYFSGGRYISGLSLYKNTGSAISPSFQLITRDYASIDSFNLMGVHPALGDLDGDGDMDMLIGSMSGTLCYFENTAGTGNPATFVLIDKKYKSIAVGQYSAPQLVDVDRDGKLDLLIGKRDATLSYYQNIGTTTLPDFSSTATTSSFGKINVREPGYTYGYSSPYLIDSNGNYKLFVGSDRGYVYLYDSIETNLNGAFHLVDSIFIKTHEGSRLSVSGGDINTDGKFDLVIGNYDGGCVIYEQPLSIFVENKTAADNFELFPNPANNTISITGIGNKTSEISVSIYNYMGQKIFSSTAHKNTEFKINTAHLSNGLYFCEVHANNIVSVKKFVVAH